MIRIDAQLLIFTLNSQLLWIPRFARNDKQEAEQDRKIARTHLSTQPNPSLPLFNVCTRKKVYILTFFESKPFEVKDEKNSCSTLAVLFCFFVAHVSAILPC